MFREFLRKKSQKGMSTVQAAMVATLVASAAAATSSVMVHNKRQNKIEQLRYSFNQVRTYGDMILLSRETLRVTSNFNPALVIGVDANRNFNRCFINDGDGMLDCAETTGLGYEGLRIRNLLNEFMIGGSFSPNRGYYEVNGKVCSSTTSPYCVTELTFFMNPVCGTKTDGIVSCEQATSYDFSYRVRSLRPYYGVTLPEVVRTLNVTHAELNQTNLAGIPNCDSANGYVPVGVQGDGSFRCATAPRNVNILAHHFLRNSGVMGCRFPGTMKNDGTFYTKTFRDLTQTAPGLPVALPNGLRRSFGGMWINPRIGSAQDLGGSGSCINNSSFMSGFYRECDASGCRAGSAGDFSLWLRKLDINMPQGTDLGSYYYDNLSECAICEIDGHVMVVHDVDNSNVPPRCPAGYDRLYPGRSLASLSLDGGDTGEHWSGYSAAQDRASIGSCLAMHDGTTSFPGFTGTMFDHARIPFAEGNHTSSTFRLGFRTGSDYAAYIGAHTPSTGETRPNYCSVCWRAQPVEP
ncbi:MAG TPA: hypothetical protein PLH57_00855 [Oligoflexia bacterium]|nr:hypothetical protein [Oligoflexia bacterium]